MAWKILTLFLLLDGFVGATLLMMGVASSYWSKHVSAVWNCSLGDDCLAVRVMMIISTVFGTIHTFIILVHMLNEVGPNTWKIFTFAFISALLTVIFGLVSIIVYKAKLEAGQSFTLASSLTLTCVGSACIFFNIIFILLEMRSQREADAYLSI
ncbi:hypothetical protein ACJMK2_002209 [Sinanodonta woodiana]|uniref:Uncharacterized protein n=1 Tax=Sinanodonta woodiana TaxID=1069815 RepID=A0ABD3XV53_SINWO